jgi:small subunit ribosomal protein S5
MVQNDRQNNRQNRPNNRYEREVKEFEEKVIEIKRVSKKTKGGNKINFSALVVIGNHKGKAGVGFGKAPDVISAIKKGVRLAKKHLTQIDITNGSIAHEILYKRGAAKVLLKPAPVGTGVIAGGAVRAVVEAFGIQNIVSKRMGTTNKGSNVHATFEALTTLLPGRKKAVNTNNPEAPKAATAKATTKSKAKKDPSKAAAKSTKKTK